MGKAVFLVGGTSGFIGKCKAILGASVDSGLSGMSTTLGNSYAGHFISSTVGRVVGRRISSR
jgi:hypothetical protein